MWHHHWSAMPTSPGAILHHTDPKGPNISGGGVLVNGNKAFTKSNEITLGPEKSTYSVFL